LYSILDHGFGLFAAFAVAAVLIPVIGGAAHRLGLVDHPTYRKRHRVVTPLTGGLGISAGLLVALLVLGASIAQYWTLWLGMAILMITGLIDDFRHLSVRLRMLIQIGAACLMVFGGEMVVQNLGPVFGPDYGPVGLGPFAQLFTIACVVFMINAINMADGLDGLAGGIAVIIFLVLAATGWMDGAPPGLITVALALALASLGFLVHNVRLPGVPRARAFLGDTGSMMLGYAIAWLAVAVATQPDAGVYPVSVAWLLLIPGMDTLALFFRRIRLGRSPFSPDRTHLHHILRRCGYPVYSTVHIIHLMVLVTGLFGVLAWQMQWLQWPLFLVAACMMVGYQLLLFNARNILRWHRKRARAAAALD